MVYLDDGLGATADKTKAKIASLQVHSDLLKQEQELNPVRSQLSPDQPMSWPQLKISH